MSICDDLKETDCITFVRCKKLQRKNRRNKTTTTTAETSTKLWFVLQNWSNWFEHMLEEL